MFKILSVLAAGAILGLLQHPLTDKGLAQFIRDSEKLR